MSNFQSQEFACYDPYLAKVTAKSFENECSFRIKRWFFQFSLSLILAVSPIDPIWCLINFYWPQATPSIALKIWVEYFFHLCPPPPLPVKPSYRFFLNNSINLPLIYHYLCSLFQYHCSALNFLSYDGPKTMLEIGYWKGPEWHWFLN